MKYLIYKIFVFSLLAGMLAGCSDVVDYHGDDMPEGASSLTIRIPNVEAAAMFGATRSDSYRNTRAIDEASEGEINNLYVVAVPTDDENDFTIYPFSAPTNTTGKYKEYNVVIFPGNYRLYVIANINDYLRDDDEQTLLQYEVHNEDELKNLIIHFQSVRPLQAGNLPMACFPKDIVSDAIADGVITIIKNEKKKITANLSYLCSKVRYTILFDNEDFSNGFGNSTIDFLTDKASATNIRQYTALTDEGTASKDFLSSYWGIELAKYKYPSGTDYPTSESDNLESFVEDDELSGKKAWQGVAYLPENNQDGVERTILNFPYLFDGEEGQKPKIIELFAENHKLDHEVHGLERGKMYDVVVKVKNPDETEMEATVKVSNWDMENLSYQLHGPYELVLETATVSIEAGDAPKTYWFRSDAKVTAESPQVKVNDTDTDVFRLEVAQDENGNGTFTVSLNPEIPPTTDVSGCNYFYLKAGNLRKRIDVYPFVPGAFLSLDKDEITIDVSEIIGQGMYSGYIDVPFSTNLDDLTLNLSGDDTGDSFPINADYLQISIFDKNGAAVSGYDVNIAITTNSISLPHLHEGILRISYSGLHDGLYFWRTPHNYELIIEEGNKTENEVGKINISIIPWLPSTPPITEEEPHSYRLYWQDVDDHQISIKINDEEVIPWGSHGKKYEELEGWYYIDFDTELTEGDFSYKIDENYYITNNDTQEEIRINNGLSNFISSNNDSFKSAFVTIVDKYTINYGTPTEAYEETLFIPDALIRIKWKQTYNNEFFDFIYVFDSGLFNTKEYPGNSYGDKEQGYGNWGFENVNNAIYYIYTIDSLNLGQEISKINFIINSGKNGLKTKELVVTPANSEKNNDIYTITIDIESVLDTE